ncbi:MAG: hypothetical protein ACOH2Q_09030 [Rhodococcus sp. (in: high G+C Gram-positive bacteria)]
MLRAELLKLTTTAAPRTAIGIGAVGLILTQLAFVIILPLLAAGRIGPGRQALGNDFPVVDLTTVAAQTSALSPLGDYAGGGGSIGVAAIAVTLLGVLAGTGDYRFGGIVTTALAQPKRGRILIDKAAAAGIAGLLTGGAYAAISMVMLLITLAVQGTAWALDPLSVGAFLTRSVVAVGCLVVIGLAVGILARNQLFGVLTMLGILVLEPIIQAIARLSFGELPFWAQLSPLSLANSVISGGHLDAGQTGLSLPVALGSLIALTGTTLAAAALALERRDI